MNSALKRYLIGQFNKPHGPLGMVAGWIMAGRDSNRRRNLWTIERMGLKATDRVLEIGYGPGFALEQVCARLTDGRAVGLDHSTTMYHMARARNRKAIGSGRLELKVGSADDLENADHQAPTERFDHIYAVNVAMFWRDPVRVLRTLGRHLESNGRIYLTYQPRVGDRTDEAALAVAERLAGEMQAAGLREVRTETLKDVSPMAVCVVGSRGMD